jgi:hypothetical protein
MLMPVKHIFMHACFDVQQLRMQTHRLKEYIAKTVIRNKKNMLLIETNVYSRSERRGLGIE